MSYYFINTPFGIKMTHQDECCYFINTKKSIIMVNNYLLNNLAMSGRNGGEAGKRLRNKYLRCLDDTININK